MLGPRAEPQRPPKVRACFHQQLYNKSCNALNLIASSHGTGKAGASAMAEGPNMSSSGTAPR